jgi:hypothetical protein
MLGQKRRLKISSPNLSQERPLSIFDIKLEQFLIHSNCREYYHRWIIHVVPFLVICVTSHGSSRLRRHGFVKLEDPQEYSRNP